MKINFLFIFFIIAQSAEANTPTIIFDYKSTFDKSCDTPVKKEISNEATQKLKHFKSLWKLNSKELMPFIFSNFTWKFKQNKYNAKLSACPSVVSYSRPLVLNISRFLVSYTGNEKVNPDYAFIVLVFHELMHNWIEDNLKSSFLLEKYQGESRTVKVHLHLMALEKFTYIGLNRFDLLSWIEKKYPAIGGDYARAWEIVHIEGHQAFIDELK